MSREALNVLVTPATIKRLDRIAGRTGGTRSDAVRQALYWGIRELETQTNWGHPTKEDAVE